MLYFAYGSNLNRRAMARRCPRAKALGIARLDGYRLVFREYLDIAPDLPSTVWGGLYQLTPACARALDKYEDAPHLYRKITISVLHEGKPCDVMIYVMNAKHVAPPKVAYYGVVARGYAEWKLDQGPLLRARLAVINGRSGGVNAPP